MKVKSDQLHHKSRGRPPTRAIIRGGPAHSKFVLCDPESPIQDTCKWFGNWKRRMKKSQIVIGSNELQFANSGARRRLAYGPLARDWVIFTCYGHTKAKPDRHNHIAVSVENELFNQELWIWFSAKSMERMFD